jgi:hypothetical protein
MTWPYPAENQQPWFRAFEDFVAAMDASGYASREDRSVIFTGGGVIAWNAGISQLSWLGVIKLLSPIAGFTWNVQPATLTIADGQLVYVELTRSPSGNLNVTPVVASQVPGSDVAMILCVRMGNKIYWRNGLALDDGASVTDIGAGSGGGGGGASYFVFQPGGVPDGVVVFDKWGDLHTAVQASPGEKIVIVDDSLGSAAVAAGAWDISGWLLKGKMGQLPTLEVPEGATFTANAGTFWKIESLQLLSARTTGYVSDFSSFGFVFVGFGASIEGSDTRPFFRIQGFGNSQLHIHLENGGTLGQINGNVVETAQQGQLYIHLYDGSWNIGLQAFEQAAPGAGQLTYRIWGNSPAPTFTQLDYIDPPTYDRKADLRYMALVYKEFVLNDQQTGTTELHIGSVYLTAGTVVRGGSEAMLGGSLVGETANLRLRRYTGGAAVGGVFTTIGTLAPANPLGGDFTIADSDWYDIYLYAGGVGETAIVKGLRLVLEPSIANGV